MSSLLRCFREHRELLDEVGRLRQQARLASDTSIDLGDKVRDQAAEIQRLSGELADARKETIHSVQCVADWVSQHTFGSRIYSRAPTLPATPPAEIVNQRVQARRVVEDMEREFFEKYAATE